MGTTSACRGWGGRSSGLRISRRHRRIRDLPPRCGRTVMFAVVTVPLELALGLAVALLMHTAVRGRALVRLAALLPWAIPTVVAALVWRFMFDAQGGVITATLRRLAIVGESFDWFVHPVAAWIPTRRGGRLENDTVRRNSAARGSAEHRPGAPRSGP